MLWSVAVWVGVDLGGKRKGFDLAVIDERRILAIEGHLTCGSASARRRPSEEQVHAERAALRMLLAAGHDRLDNEVVDELSDNRWPRYREPPGSASFRKRLAALMRAVVDYVKNQRAYRCCEGSFSCIWGPSGRPFPAGITFGPYRQVLQ